MRRKTEIALIRKSEPDHDADLNILLMDVDTLKANAHIDENVNDKDIRIAIKYVQDIIIEQVTGTGLFRSLKAMIGQDAIFDSQNRDYKYLLDEYLADIFIWGVPAQLPVPLSYKIRNSGQVMTYSDGISNSESDDLKYTTQWYMNKVDFYVKRAINYLHSHLCCYPELAENCRCAWYVRAMGKQPATPVNLKPVRPAGSKRGY